MPSGWSAELDDGEARRMRRTLVSLLGSMLTIPQNMNSAIWGMHA